MTEIKSPKEARKEKIKRWGWKLLSAVFIVWLVSYAVWLGYKVATSAPDSGWIVAFIWFVFWGINLVIDRKFSKLRGDLMDSVMDLNRTILKDFKEVLRKCRNLRASTTALRANAKALRKENEALKADNKVFSDAIEALKKPVKKLTIKKAPDASKKAK